MRRRAAWALAGLTGLALLLRAKQWRDTVRFAGRLNEPIPPPDAAGPGLSLIVPIKGADPETAANFRALRRFPPGKAPFEVLIVMETDGDPAFPVAQTVAAETGAGAFSVHLSGLPEPGVMGKLHNMERGWALARHELVAFMDADVRVGPDTLAALVHTLTTDSGDGLGPPGCAYPVPMDAAPVTLGGAILADALSHRFAPILLERASADALHFAVGALMGFRREALQSIGGVGAARNRMSDDASLGKLVYEAGYAVRLVPRVVTLPAVPLSTAHAFENLRKWGVVVRSFFGRPTFGLVVPLTLDGMLAVLTVVAARGARPACARLGAAVASRVAFSWDLDRRLTARPWPLGWYLVSAAGSIGEIGGWAQAMTVRTLRWKGRTYRVSPTGEIIPHEIIHP